MRYLFIVFVAAVLLLIFAGCSNIDKCEFSNGAKAFMGLPVKECNDGHSFKRGDKVRYLGRYNDWYDSSCDIRVIAQQATEKHNEVWVLISNCHFFRDGENPRTGIFYLEELTLDK